MVAHLRCSLPGFLSSCFASSHTAGAQLRPFTYMTEFLPAFFALTIISVFLFCLVFRQYVMTSSL